MHGRFWRFHADVKLKRFRVLSARNSTDKTDSTQVSRAAEFRARGVLSVWTASESHRFFEQLRKITDGSPLRFTATTATHDALEQGA